MSELAQEAEASSVDTTPVPNEEPKDDKSQPTEHNDNDEQSPVEPVEPSPEEKLAEAEKLNEQRQKKIDRQTASYNAIQKTLQERTQELEALRQQVQTEAPQEPKIDDFETFEEFDKARVDFINKQAEQTAQEKLLQQQQQMQAQQQLQARMDLRAAQEADYIKDNPHYRTSVSELDTFFKTAQINDGVAEAVLDVVYDGNVPQIIDYFGKNNGENLDKLAEIARMTPVKAAIETYKIQQSLTTPVSKEETQPPKPVNKPKGKGAPKKDIMDGSVLKNLGIKN